MQEMSLEQLQDHYTATLQAYLVMSQEASLQQAYELGRRALSQGLGVLAMVAIHHRALTTVVSRAATSEETARIVQAGESFFVESLSSFEMAHRGFRDANSALRGLNQKLEDEAKRIAHALHDEAGQLLAAVHIALDEATDALPLAHRERLGQVKALVSESEAHLRRLSHELRPTILDDLGLVPALEFLAQGVASRAKIPVSVDSAMTERLPPVVETALYRIVQEALTNVIKHAQATRVDISLQRHAHLVRCAVCDNGVGYDVRTGAEARTRPGLGLRGIRERLEAVGGTLVMTSSPGHGTTLVVTIPLES